VACSALTKPRKLLIEDQVSASCMDSKLASNLSLESGQKPGLT